MDVESLERWAADGDEDAIDAAVLLHAVEIFPAKVTTSEMARELGGEQATAAVVGAVASAAGRLAKPVLIHAKALDEDEMIEPTRAALRYNELLNIEDRE